MTRKSIVIDVDLVLSQSADKSIPYYQRKPYPHAIKWMRKLKAAGFFIRIQTARGMDQFGKDLGAIHDFHHDQLERWLNEAGIPFDEIYFGKAVTTTYYVDDLAFRVESEKGEQDWQALGKALGLPDEAAPVSV